MHEPSNELPLDPSPRNRFTRKPTLISLLLIVVFAGLASAQEATTGAANVPADDPAPTLWTIDTESSVFAVITHKAGLAAKLAHNHIVTAQDVEAELSFDPATPAEIQFSFKAPVAQLRIDDPDDQQRWYAAIEALGILNEAFSEIAPDKREDIYESMNSRKQLDGKNYPSLGGRLASKPQLDDAQQTFTVELEFEVKGEKARRPIKGQYSFEGDRLTIEASGEFAFTDFGIKPYSAMLGAVKNSDQIHVFLHLEATH